MSAVLYTFAAGSHARYGEPVTEGMTQEDGTVLPGEVTSFVGRRREVAGVKRCLQSSRLVTVTGPGGVGKTRIALRVAAEVRRVFADGVRFAELSGLTDAQQLEQAVVRALEPGDMSPLRGLRALAAQVADRQLLLVLDACEHLVDACAHLIQTLLEAGPEIRVLVTSRQQLGVPGEYIMPIPPMAVPAARSSLAALARVESVALFLDRATAVDPDFSLTEANAAAVAELCARLEGVPLAIELAAVRLRALPLDRIAEPAEGGRGAVGGVRSRGLWATIDRSHELCTPQERLAWARLSVFAGRFELSAAETVCAGGELPRECVFPAISGLVEKSILTPVRHEDGTSYRMLDMIREYGLTRLAEAGERELMLVRHRDHYLGAAIAAVEREGEPEAERLRRWLRLRRDWANIRAALEYCVATPGQAEAGLMIASRLWFLWVACGMGREGRHYLERLIGLAPASSALRCWSMIVLSYIAVSQGDLTGCRRVLDWCLAEAEEVGADEYLTQAMMKMSGTHALMSGDLARGLAQLGAALARFRSTARPARPLPVALAALVELGVGQSWAGDTEAAERSLRECLELCEKWGDFWIRSYAEYGMAGVARSRGELDEAISWAREGLRAKRALPDMVGSLLCMDLLSWLLAERGEHRRAARLLEACATLSRKVGLALFAAPLFHEEHERCRRTVRAALSARELERAVRKGAAMSFEEAVADALGEDGAGPAAARRGRWDPLTPREGEVAELVAQGLTNREIADRLVVAARTVDSHVAHILAKLGFSARAQVAAWVTMRKRNEEQDRDEGTAQ